MAGEKNDVDGALLPLANADMVSEYWYEREEFAFVDLERARFLRRMGRGTDADNMLGRIVAKAARDSNLILEMYDALDFPLFHGNLGDPTGATPMAGYGAGAFILHLLDRSGAGGRANHSKASTRRPAKVVPISASRLIVQ